MVVLDDLEQPSSSHQTSERNGEPVRKKCMLEKLLDTTFSDSADSSVTVSHNELVMAELSRYKSEPVLELKKNHWSGGTSIPQLVSHGTEIFRGGGNICSI